VFEIEILNPEGVERGVTSLQVDGKELHDRKIPIEDPAYGSVVAVRVTLGK
jgi:hypothetical protein